VSALVRIGLLTQLPPGTATHFITGEEAIAVCNVGGHLYAMDGICPHSGGPLGHGALDGHMLSCPFHGWAFDCRTGASDVSDMFQVATYPVTLIGDDIFVELPVA
jgi:nitrite reductase/ring-hydroxylating ferredoxin subunit